MGYFFLLVWVSLAACTRLPIRDDLGPHLTREAMIGGWMGHDTTGTFYALFLTEDERGSFVSCNGTNRVDSYPISKWTVTGGHGLNVTFAGGSNARPAFAVEWDVSGDFIILTTRGWQWQRTALLVREAMAKRQIQMAEEVARQQK